MYVDGWSQCWCVTLRAALPIKKGKRTISDCVLSPLPRACDAADDDGSGPKSGVAFKISKCLLAEDSVSFIQFIIHYYESY